MRAEGIGSAGGERRTERLIFQVFGCRQEGIGDGVQAGGGRSAGGRRVGTRGSRQQVSGVERAGGRESERRSAGGPGVQVENGQ